MATHSSVLAWKIPGTAEPGGLLSMGSQQVLFVYFYVSVCFLPWEPNIRKYYYKLHQRMFSLYSLLGVLWCHFLNVGL